MKIQRIALTLVWMLAIPICAHADAFLSHTSGNAEVFVSDFGSLGTIRDGTFPASNFKFPKTGSTFYLQEFSEIWIGDANGNVATTWEVTNQFVLGDWATTAAGKVNKVEEPDGRQIITAQYESSRRPNFPLNILVDQESFSWSASNDPNADDFIVVKLVIINNSNIDLSGIFVAFMANWDIDGTDIAAGKLSQDWVDWDEGRQTLFTYDGDDTDGTNPVHMGLTLLDGKLRTHQIFTFIDFNGMTERRLFVDRNRSLFMTSPAPVFATNKQELEARGVPPWDYVSILSAGPYDISAQKFVTVTFALVAGENLADLQKNINEARRISFAPQRLTAEVIPEVVMLKWEESINPSVTAYSVLRRTAEEREFQPIGPRVVSGISFDDTQIDKFGVEHIYKIRPLDISGRPIEFDSLEVRVTPDRIPDAPTGLTAALSGDQVILNWAKSTDPIGGYVIYRNHTGNEPWTPIVSVSPDETTFVDVNVYPGLSYFYAIAAKNRSDAQGEFSTEANVVTPPGEAVVTPASNLENVIVVPNPYRLGTNDNRIEFRNLTGHATIRIYSSAGDLIKIIDHIDESPIERWDGRNEKGELISTGIYVYYIQTVREAGSIEAVRETGSGRISTSGKFAAIR